MDLTTRCPQCGTIFQASLEQLQLRKGYVRCVQCAHIFDGYEAVVPGESVSDSRSEPTLMPPPGSTRGMAAEQSADVADDAGHAPLPEEQPSIPSVVRARREFTISDQNFRAISGGEPSFGMSNLTGSAPADDRGGGVRHSIADLDADHVEIVPEDHFKPDYYPARRSDKGDTYSDRWGIILSLVWRVLIVAGIIVFAAQLAYVFRVQLAEHVPALRPSLERMCEALQCEVAYSRQSDMIVITQSSLQKDTGKDAQTNEEDDATAAADENNEEVLILQLTLRNAYDKPQEWPTLVLDLKDFSGASIARKSLPKDVYLPADLVDTPFPASSERLIVLPLTMQGLNVNGYQLSAFFP